jgi:hypothetical protein
MIDASTKPSTPWLILFSRLVLFVSVQAFFALGFLLTGSTSAWETGANWWPFVVTIANLICVVLLIRCFRSEGRRYWDIFRIRKEIILGDVLIVLGLFLIGGPLGYFPNPLLSKMLFGDPQLVLPMMIRSLPWWAVYASIILFPITQGFAELPTYFGYVMPRLEAQGLRKWLAITLPSLMLGLQHICVPLLFDLRFILWRGLMYLPFAFFVGIVLHWRPRLLPYMAIVHVLMDLSFAMMLLNVAY